MPNRRFEDVDGTVYIHDCFLCGAPVCDGTCEPPPVPIESEAK